MTSGAQSPNRARPQRSEPRSLDAAHAWIDANLRSRSLEEVPLGGLVGRVLACDVMAAADEPPQTRAAIDGLALRASETVGANAYNPLTFALSASGGALPSQSAARVNAGDALPAGADTVAPYDDASLHGSDRCEIIDAVPPGFEVEAAGSQIARGSVILSAGRVLRASDLGLLALAGLDRAAVHQRPRIGLVLAGRGLDQTPDADGPMLRALIARDGGDVTATRSVGRGRGALRDAFMAPGCDAIVAAGGTGRGSDDHAGSVLSEIGVTALADIAINPGGTAAIGRTSEGTCVLLLPGRPAACLWAYELIAGRALRRLAGRDPSLPFAQRPLTLGRKIVSAIGLTEICPVRQTADGHVEPLAAFARDSLMATSQADGFVVVPEGSEGFAAGATVPVYLLRTAS